MYLYFHAFIVCINSNNFVSGFMAVKTINLMPTGYCSVAKHLEFLISYGPYFLKFNMTEGRLNSNRCMFRPNT